MARIIALDYGTKRTGVAVTDPLRIIAAPLETIPTHRLMEFLVKYISENSVDTIVVGLPTQMDGSPSESFRHIEPFVKRLTKTFDPEQIKVVYYDERFTSLMAQRSILESGVKKMQRRDKGAVDRVSAAIILKDYMESIKR